MSKIIGIDLGTTNTVCAAMISGEPEIILNSNQETVTPSTVAFRNGNEHIIGQPAVNQAVENPDKTIHSVKRYIGNEEHEFDMGFDTFKPEEISALILQKVRKDAEEYLNEPVEEAVITVPAYFNDRQRKATKRAGEIAGLDVKRIINEPTAAAIAYGMDKDREQNVLITDLGGGTFDVSILELGDGVCDVIATDGIRHLGGNDWDQAIVDHLIEDFRKQNGVNLYNQPQPKERLRQEAEEAKKKLTNQHQTIINIPFITSTEDGPLHLEKKLTRETFNNITEDLRKRIKEPIENSLSEANLRKRDLENVILVGGATKMPQIKRQIRTIAGTTPHSKLDQDEVVAMGAAIQASILKGNNDEMILLDVTPQNVGIEVKGGVFEPIIRKNTTIPTKRKKIYTTSKDDQETVEIKVYQGNNQIAKENELLGDFILRGIPKAEAGTPRIEMEYKIDADGILYVTAKETSTEVEKTVKIDRDKRANEDDIDSMKDKANEYEEAAVSEKERINARKDADEMVTKAEKILLTDEIDMSPSEAIKVEERIEYVDETLEKDDATTNEIKRVTKSLGKLISELLDDTKENGSNDKKAGEVW